jgi:hypothetical protein
VQFLFIISKTNSKFYDLTIKKEKKSDYELNMNDSSQICDYNCDHTETDYPALPPPT